MRLRITTDFLKIVVYTFFVSSICFQLKGATDDSLFLSQEQLITVQHDDMEVVAKQAILRPDKPWSIYDNAYTQPQRQQFQDNTFGQGLELKETEKDRTKHKTSKEPLVVLGGTILYLDFAIDHIIEIEGAPVHFFTTPRNHYIGWYSEVMAPGIVSPGFRIGGGQERYRLHWEMLGLSLEPINSSCAWLYGVGLFGLNLRGGPFLLAPRIGAVLGWSILTLRFENGETLEETGTSGFFGWSYELGIGLGLKKAGIYAAYCVFEPFYKTMNYTVEEGVTLTGTYDNPHEIRLGIYIQE